MLMDPVHELAMLIDPVHEHARLMGRFHEYINMPSSWIGSKIMKIDANMAEIHDLGFKLGVNEIPRCSESTLFSYGTFWESATS